MTRTISGQTLLKKHVGSSDRVLLVNPPVQETRYSWLRWNQPLDLLKVGAFLKREIGCEVELLDCMKPDSSGKVLMQRVPGSLRERVIGGETYPIWRYGQPYDALREWLVERRANGRRDPTQIWISSLCSYWYQSVAQISTVARQAAPDAKLVLQGNLARLSPKHAAEVCPVDLVVTKAAKLNGVAADVGLYGAKRPPFLALDLHAETAAQEMKEAVKRGVYRFAIFGDDVCAEDGGPLLEILEKGRGLHRNVRFHLICGLYPSRITREVASVLAQPLVAEAHLEQESDGEGLAEESYRELSARMAKSGAHIPAKKINSFLWIGRPGERLDDIVPNCLRMLDLVGSFILKPYSPTPGSADAIDHAEYLEALPRDQWSPHFFPFAELNGISRSEYSDLYRMAAFLNDKVRSESFNLFHDNLGSRLLRESIRREAWNVGE